MKLKTLYLLGLVAMISATCATNKQTKETASQEEQEMNLNKYSDDSSIFRGVSITSQTTFPGVQSNLKGITKYQVSLSAEIKENITFKRLMVDSISIPISGLMVGGDKIKGEKLESSSDLVKLTAFRYLYSSSAANKIHEEVTYELSGLDLESTSAYSAVLEYFKNEKPYYISITNIDLLPAIYAP